MLSFFPRGVLDEISNLIESVSEDFPSYSYIFSDKQFIIKILDRNGEPLKNYLNLCQLLSEMDKRPGTGVVLSTNARSDQIPASIEMGRNNDDICCFP